MKVLIVTKPILNIHKESVYYCFRYQLAKEFLDSQHMPSRQFENAINLPCLEVLEKVGLDGLTNGFPLLVPVSMMTLLSDVTRQCTQPPEKVIFLLDHQLELDDSFYGCISGLKKAGFRFAIENVKDYDAMKPLVDLCDMILISFARNRNAMEEYQRMSRIYTKKEFVASDIDAIPTFEKIKFSGFNLFEGKFTALPIVKGGNTIAPVKVNRIQLMNLVREPDFAIDEVVKIVSRDPSLSISLLKMVNSPYLALNQKIKNISQAVAFLGQNEMRKWVVTATTGMLADDKPLEITRISLIRAKFAENLAPLFEKAIHAPSLFLMGLFSILDVLLEMSMYSALKVVSVPDVIQEALIYNDGDFAPVLNLILRYEAADWSEVKRLLMMTDIDVEDVYNAYIGAVQWYTSVVSYDGTEESEA